LAAALAATAVSHVAVAAGAFASRVGQPADIASSAYTYRADLPPTLNPPEGWLLLMQYANQPFDRAPDLAAPAIKRVLCGLLWEEVRPVRRVELAWPAGTAKPPAPAEVALA